MRYWNGINYGEERDSSYPHSKLTAQNFVNGDNFWVTYGSAFKKPKLTLWQKIKNFFKKYLNA